MWSSPQWLSHMEFSHTCVDLQFHYPIQLFMIYMDTDAAAIKQLLCLILVLLFFCTHQSGTFFSCQRKDSFWFLEAYRVLINLLAKFLVGQPELSSIKIDWRWIIFQPMVVTSSGESRDENPSVIVASSPFPLSLVALPLAYTFSCAKWGVYLQA